MNRINPKKLQHSKWTAAQPRNKEKHFVVVEVCGDAEGYPQTCVLEAVHSHRKVKLDWRELEAAGQWLTGWR